MSRKSVKRDWEKFDATTMEELDDSDMSGLDETVFDRVPTTFPPPKKQLTIRLDEDMLTWFKGQGRGYQTRINAILRAYYDAHQHCQIPKTSSAAAEAVRAFQNKESLKDGFNFIKVRFSK